jgi:hypothetical protein
MKGMAGGSKSGGGKSGGLGKKATGFSAKVGKGGGKGFGKMASPACK